jgi:hypothetical protein
VTQMSDGKEKGRQMDPENVKEIFGIFSEKMPALLNSLTDSIYGKDASAKFGQAVANFYTTLKKSGMTDEQAFKLSEQYMSSLNLGGIIARAVSRRGEGGE